MAARQERRARLRQAVKEVASRGIAPEQGVWGTIAATRILLDVLDSRSAERASDAARRAVEIFDQSVRRNPPEAPLACARGCALCCHSFVTATAPEIFLLARTLRASRGDLSLILDDLRANLAVTGGLNKPDRFAVRRACSLLANNNECRGYAGRPLACRAFASFSLAKCEQAFATGAEEIPTPALHAYLRRACRQALWSALAASGLPCAGYELNQGLMAALGNARAEARWLKGDDVLAAVQTDEVSLALAEPSVRLYLDVIAAVADGREPPPNEWI